MLKTSTGFRLASSLSCDTLSGSVLRTTEQLIKYSIASISGSSWPARGMHTSTSLAQEAQATADEEFADKQMTPIFVSQQRSQRPKVRHPIFFPDITLQMIRITPEQLEQIRATGWTREAVFKTTPNVTKAEIKAYLEAVYGMQVERVQTINYLGKLHKIAVKAGRATKLYREDDWKKAYVTFAPPPGIELEAPPRPAAHAEMLATVRAARGAPAQRPGRTSALDSGSLLDPNEALQFVVDKQAREQADSEDKEKKAGKADYSKVEASAPAAAAAPAADNVLGLPAEVGQAPSQPAGGKQA